MVICYFYVLNCLFFVELTKKESARLGFTDN